MKTAPTDPITGNRSPIFLGKGCRRTGSHRVVRARFVSQGIDSSDEKFQLLLLVLRGPNPLLILATLTF
jgi:hypothetical protein